MYHAGMPAWAFDANGALIGCLLRNTPGDGSQGAVGSDPAPHTQHYALRVPTGLGAPETGQPLQEALGFHTPLLAARMPDGEQYDGMLTEPQAALAALPAGSPAVLTAAKPGSYDPTSLVLRLYQPTNTSQKLDVALPIRPRSAQPVTATEIRWGGGGSAGAGKWWDYRHHGGSGGHGGDRGTWPEQLRRRLVICSPLCPIKSGRGSSCR